MEHVASIVFITLLYLAYRLYRSKAQYEKTPKDKEDRKIIDRLHTVMAMPPEQRIWAMEELKQEIKHYKRQTRPRLRVVE